MGENCRSFACYLDNIRRNRENVDSRSRNGGNDEENFERNQNMRVILPVIIVIAIFIILAIAFIIYRFAAVYIRKRWMVWRQDGHGHAEAQSGETRRRARNGQNVSAVSAQLRDRPPSYRQVLASIQRDEPPPAYDSVVTGVVNEGYDVATDDSPRRSDDFGRTYEDIVVTTHDMNTPPRTQLPHAIHTHSNTQNTQHVRPQRQGRRSNQHNHRHRSNNRPTVNQPSRRVDMPPSPLILRSATLETDHHHHLSYNHQTGNQQEQSNISSTSEDDTSRQSVDISRSKSDISPHARESNCNIRRSSTSVNSKDVNTSVIQTDIVMVV